MNSDELLKILEYERGNETEINTKKKKRLLDW